jgi:hypothetical protein
MEHLLEQDNHDGLDFRGMDQDRAAKQYRLVKKRTAGIGPSGQDSTAKTGLPEHYNHM